MFVAVTAGCVRGRDLVDAVAFVEESFGPEAHPHVLAFMAPPERASFEAPLKLLRWYDLQALVGYLVTARSVLAPADDDFYRRQGYFAGQRQKAGLLGRMVATPEMRMRMAPTVWHMFYDIGRLIVVGTDPATAAGQIHGFPATPELCQRFRGIWEGTASTADRPAVASETLCVLRGDPCCRVQGAISRALAAFGHRGPRPDRGPAGHLNHRPCVVLSHGARLSRPSSSADRLVNSAVASGSRP